MKEPVHVLCASNAKYFMPMCVMLVSLVDNFDPDRELVIHIISNEVSAEDRKNLRESLEMNRPGLEHIQVHWYSVDARLTSEIEIGKDKYYSADCFSRLLAPDILPADCEKVLYLDCDIIVLADVSKLYDECTNHDTVVFAAEDIGCRASSQLGIFDYAERGIAPEARTFNSAVIVMNFRRWRERGLTPVVIDYLAKYGERVHGDQGALNAFLHDEWKEIDIRWNLGTAVLFPEVWKKAGYTLDRWREVKDNPFIIHYSGAKKPWQPGRRAPRYSYFFKYFNRTVFKDSIPRQPHLEQVIGLPAYFYLWKWTRDLLGAIKN